MVKRLAFLIVLGLLRTPGVASLRTFLRRAGQSAEADASKGFDSPVKFGDRVTPAVLHFMFELKDRFPFPDIWGQFWDGAPSGTYMSWAHCTDQHACENDYVMNMLRIRLVPTVWSTRGADLMTPYVHMMQLAMDETRHLRGTGVLEKFIVISDSTLPIKPFSFAYRQLTATPESDICISTPAQWAHGVFEGTPLALVKQHQWAVLNRTDGELLVRDWRPVHQMLGWNVPLREGKWAGQNRTVPRKLFKGGTWYTATDEEAVYAFIRGPMVLPTPDDLDLPFKLLNSRRCYTYVSFPNDLGPEVAATTPGPSLLQLSESISPDEYVRFTREVLDDPDTNTTVQRGIWHPFMFKTLGKQSMLRLRRSQYLFARKFSPCARLANYSAVMFAE